MVEFRRAGAAVQLWATTPVDVTVVLTGSGGPRRLKATATAEAKRIAHALLPIARVLNTPNGKPTFRALFRGLTVARFELVSPGSALVVTPGGTVLKVTAENGKLLPLELTCTAIQTDLLVNWDTIDMAVTKQPPLLPDHLHGVYETFAGETE